MEEEKLNDELQLVVFKLAEKYLFLNKKEVCL